MSAAWRPGVLAELQRHGLQPGPGDTPAALRERLNELYLEQVRALRERQRAGEIALSDYSRHVEELRGRFELLGLPLAAWTA